MGINKSLILYLSILLLMTGSCGFATLQNSNSGAESIIIELAPTKKIPEVFQKGGEFVCRRGFPLESSYGLVPVPTTDTTTNRTSGDNALDGSQQPLSSQEQEDAKQDTIVKITVSDSWFQMGLHFGNRTAHYLIIDQMSFTMSAQWGMELLQGTDEIASGYCDTDPLYIVPPQQKMRYEPDKKNYPNNLTLFVKGVPIPQGPQQYGLKNGVGGGAAGGVGAGGAGIGGQQQPQAGATGVPNARGGGGAGGVGGNPLLQQQEVFVLDRLPSYKIDLVIHGHFIDKERNYKSNFARKMTFHTNSQFIR